MDGVLLVAVIGAIASVFASVVALTATVLVYLTNRKIGVVVSKVQEVHLEINSRFTQLLASEIARARAEGVVEGSSYEPSDAAREATRVADNAATRASELHEHP